MTACAPRLSVSSRIRVSACVLLDVFLSRGAVGAYVIFEVNKGGRARAHADIPLGFTALVRNRSGYLVVFDLPVDGKDTISQFLSNLNSSIGWSES